MRGSINDMSAEMEDIDRQQERELIPAYERLYLRLQKKLALTEHHRDLAEETLTRVETERLAAVARVAELEQERDDARSMAKEFLKSPPQPEDWGCLSRRYDWWDSV